MSRRQARKRRQAVKATILPERPFPPPDRRQQFLNAAVQATAAYLAQEALRGLLVLLLRCVRWH